MIFVIIQKTRPLIGMPNPEEELRLLEEKANATYGVYIEKVKTKEQLLQDNIVIEEASSSTGLLQSDAWGGTM